MPEPKVIIFDFDQTLIEKSSNEKVKQFCTTFAEGKNYLKRDERRVFRVNDPFVMRIVDRSIIPPQKSKKLARELTRNSDFCLHKENVKLISDLLLMEDVYVGITSFGVDEVFIREVCAISFRKAGYDPELVTKIYFDVHWPSTKDDGNPKEILSYGNLLHTHKIWMHLELNIEKSIAKDDILLVGNLESNSTREKKNSYKTLYGKLIKERGGLKEHYINEILSFVGTTLDEKSEDIIKLGEDPMVWSVDDVGQWLQLKGFSEVFVQLFKDEGVDGDMLINESVEEFQKQLKLNPDDEQAGRLLDEIGKLQKESKKS